MPPRPFIGIPRKKRLHPAAEIRLRSLEDDVQVIGHDHKRVDVPGAANYRLAELFQEPIAVDVVAHDGLPPVAAGHDMIDGVGVLKA